MFAFGLRCLLQAKARRSLQSTCSPIHLGEHWAAAKPPSGRFALHSVGFCIGGVARKERVAVDLHLVLLAERTLYLWRSSEGEGSSRPAPRPPCRAHVVLVA